MDIDDSDLISPLIEHKFSQTCASLDVLRSFPFRVTRERERERQKTSDNYFQRRARRSQRTATRTNLIGSFTFSRDISIRICIPRGKSVQDSLSLSLSSFRREAWEMCRFFSAAPIHPLTPLPFSLIFLPFVHRAALFFPQNKPEAPLPSGPRILGGTYISSIV